MADFDKIFLSTLSLRRATVGLNLVRQMEDISIHALLAESDGLGGFKQRRIDISIHALLAESDRSAFMQIPGHLQFLSTLSLRRATADIASFAGLCKNFYPRSPCGERPHSAGPWQGGYTDFYPRSPCGERRGDRFPVVDVLPISIHALLAESDYSPRSAAWGCFISIHALLAESDTGPG